MPHRRKTHRISRPVRKTARAFNLFADRLASMIVAEVKTALQAAVAEAERGVAAGEEATPVVEAAPVKVRRRRAKIARVDLATAPQAPRKRGRPPKVNLLTLREPAGAAVDLHLEHVAAEPAAAEEPVDTTPVVTVKIIPPRRRRRRLSRLLPDQVKPAEAAPQVILRPGRLGKVEPVDSLISPPSPEIAEEAAVTAGGTAQVKEPEIVPEEVVAEEPVMSSPTKPPDRMTRMRDSFRPGKIALVADDAAVPAPEGDRPPEE